MSNPTWPAFSVHKDGTEQQRLKDGQNGPKLPDGSHLSCSIPSPSQEHSSKGWGSLGTEGSAGRTVAPAASAPLCHQGHFGERTALVKILWEQANESALIRSVTTVFPTSPALTRTRNSHQVSDCFPVSSWVAHRP